MLWFPLKIPAWIRWPSPSTARHVLYGIILGFSLALTSSSLALYFQARKRQHLVARFEPRPIELRSDDVLSGVTGLIGASFPSVGQRVLDSKPITRKYTSVQNKFLERCTWCRDTRKG